MTTRLSKISDTSAKILDARANAAARKLEMLAQLEECRLEEELEQLQAVQNQRKREIEQHRLEMLLRVEETKLQLYEETQKRENQRREIFGSGSRLYTALYKYKKCDKSHLTSKIVPVSISSRKNLGWTRVGGLGHQEEVNTSRSSCRSIEEMKRYIWRHAHRKEARCVALPNDSEMKYGNVHTIQMPEEVYLPECVEHFSYRVVGRITILQQRTERRRNPNVVNANRVNVKETATRRNMISAPFREESASGLTDGPKNERCMSQDDMPFAKKVDEGIHQDNDDRCSTRLQLIMKPCKQRNGYFEARRYSHLKRRFRQDERYFRDDQKIADEILEHGYDAKIPPDKLQSNFKGIVAKRNRTNGTEEMVQIIY